MDIQKYPRTPHLEGSRLQVGDHDLSQIKIEEIKHRFLVLEEKLDGANVGISFDESGKLMLQSRGHFLTGGPREKHFALFKAWANCHLRSLYSLLGRRYQMYGEWLYAKHTVFYDQLPHYFLEFDIYDRESHHWLDTPTRHTLLSGSPIRSVPVLAQGPTPEVMPVTRWLTRSNYQSPSMEIVLRDQAHKQGLDATRVLSETFLEPVMEGIYVKVEEGGHTVDRLKWVSTGFTNSILDSGTHWHHRPIFPNVLAPGSDIYTVIGSY